jgi:hypothetical protein
MGWLSEQLVLTVPLIKSCEPRDKILCLLNSLIALLT